MNTILQRSAILVVTALALPVASARAQSARDSLKPSATQPTNTRPSYATARCSDGTFWTRVDRTGACVGHGGVSEFFPLNPPKDATALCGDRSYSTSLDQRTACAQHGGVRFWLRTTVASNVTGKCGDGSNWTGTDQSRACLGHGGLSEWYGVRQSNVPATKP